jgi:hypothetical protein
MESLDVLARRTKILCGTVNFEIAEPFSRAVRRPLPLPESAQRRACTKVADLSRGCRHVSHASHDSRDGRL